MSCGLRTTFSVDNGSSRVSVFGDPKTVEVTEVNPELSCAFCGRSEVNPVEWGHMLQLGDIVVHHFCLLFSTWGKQRGRDNQGIYGFLPADIKQELRRGKGLTCTFCKGINATIKCTAANCAVNFHYTCGYEAGCGFHFYAQFFGYCRKHKVKQKIPATVRATECAICMIDTDHDDAVWPPCCGKNVFHRRCLLYTAKAAGYFFKCPLCNSSSKKFLKAMKANGVFIPEQDAAWELEPHAFQELLTKYSRCDAKLCLCPDGREVTEETGNWTLVRCSSCAGSATHTKCDRVHETTNWKCHACRDKKESSGSDGSDALSDEDQVIANLPYISTLIKSLPLTYDSSSATKPTSENTAEIKSKLVKAKDFWMVSSNSKVRETCIPLNPNRQGPSNLERSAGTERSDGRGPFIRETPADYFRYLETCRNNATTPLPSDTTLVQDTGAAQKLERFKAFLRSEQKRFDKGGLADVRQSQGLLRQQGDRDTKEESGCTNVQQEFVQAEKEIPGQATSDIGNRIEQ